MEKRLPLGVCSVKWEQKENSLKEIELRFQWKEKIATVVSFGNHINILIIILLHNKIILHSFISVN